MFWKSLIRFIRKLILNLILFTLMAVAGGMIFFYMFDTGFKADYYEHKALDALNKKQYKDAFRYYTRAMDINRDKMRVLELARTEAGLGYVYLQQALENERDAPRYMTEAETHLNHAAEQFLLLGDTGRAIDVYKNLSLAYIRQLDYPAAEDYHLRLIRIYEKAGSLKGTIPLYHTLGRIYKEMDNTSRACDSWHRGVAAAQNAPASPYPQQQEYLEELKQRLILSLKENHCPDSTGEKGLSDAHSPNAP